MTHSTPTRWMLTLSALLLCTSLSLAPNAAHAAAGDAPDPDSEETESTEDIQAARRAFRGGVGRAIGGAALTGGALALIPAITEYNLNWNEPDVAFLAGSIPVLLTAGIPLLVSGIGHHGATKHLAYEQRGPMIRSRLAEALTVPWTVIGSLMGTGAMVYAIDFGGEGIVSTPGLVASATGWTLVGMGGALALDGDNALNQLGVAPERRTNYLRFSLPLLVTGSVTMFAIAPAVRTGQEKSREVPQAVIGVIGAGGGMVAAGGVSLLIGALQNAKRPDFLAERSSPVKILGASPSIDAANKKFSFTLVGTFR